MKKILSLCLIMILMLTITGCTANSSQSSDDDNEQLSMQVGFDADEYYERLESCVAQIREKTDFVPDIAASARIQSE